MNYAISKILVFSLCCLFAFSGCKWKKENDNSYSDVSGTWLIKIVGVEEKTVEKKDADGNTTTEIVTEDISREITIVFTGDASGTEEGSAVLGSFVVDGTNIQITLDGGVTILSGSVNGTEMSGTWSDSSSSSGTWTGERVA